MINVPKHSLQNKSPFSSLLNHLCLNLQIYNNGQGIPVVMHKDEKMFVPTMIFGHLLTSSNFNDEEEKVLSFMSPPIAFFSICHFNLIFSRPHNFGI